MRSIVYLSLFLVLFSAIASGKDWEFTGTIREHHDWQQNGESWTTVFVQIDTDNIALNYIRLVYRTTSGIIDSEISSWMGKPTPYLKCPEKIAALTTASIGRRCKLIFSSEKWDYDSKNTGKIELISLEWITDNDQQIEK